MLATVFLVLILACVNVANLLLARAAGRTKELAIRSAMGAGRSRVLALLLAEAAVLALGGAIVGIGNRQGRDRRIRPVGGGYRSALLVRVRPGRPHSPLHRGRDRWWRHWWPASSRG